MMIAAEMELVDMCLSKLYEVRQDLLSLSCHGEDVTEALTDLGRLRERLEYIRVKLKRVGH